MAHRYLISAALSKGVSVISGVDYSEDILATIDCLTALGADIKTDGDKVTVDPARFMTADAPVLRCRESGSTLRFFIPLALCLAKPVQFCASPRLMQRPLDVYEQICDENGFLFEKETDSLKVLGSLVTKNYKVRGDISSQFITGLIFALVYLNKDCEIEIIPPFESRPYIDMTIDALKTFGADIGFSGDYTIFIKTSDMKPVLAKVEGDYSNAAFLDAFNYIGSDVTVSNLKAGSLQGDKVYKEYFNLIDKGVPTLDISDCVDLGPILIALASVKNGAILTGTDRLKAKESDRGAAMHNELTKLGGGLVFGDNTITVPKQDLEYKGEPVDSCNDHRIVMAMSLILSKLGGQIERAEAVSKSYPGFFNDIKTLGAKVEIK